MPIQKQAKEALIAGPVAAEYGIRLSELADVMAKPGYLPLECGYTVNPDGHVVVAILTRMPGVTGEMWVWWFGWHGTETARYKLWHPDAHVYSAIADDYRSDRGMSDRQRYVGNCSYVDEYLGEDYSPLTVRFIDPEKVGFAPSRPGETNIVARGGFSTSPISFAWLLHQVRATEDGSEMRSRFIVNDLTILDLPSRSIPAGKGRLLTNPIARWVAGKILPLVGGVTMEHFAPRMLFHCAQEMNHLASFLPALYEEFSGTP